MFFWQQYPGRRIWQNKCLAMLLAAASITAIRLKDQCDIIIQPDTKKHQHFVQHIPLCEEAAEFLAA